MRSTSPLCVRAVLALVVLELLYSASGSLGQSICSDVLTPFSLPAGTAAYPVSSVGCNPWSYPNSLDFTFINNGSTGNLTWILYNSSTTPALGQVATSSGGPTTNGSTTSCGAGGAPGGLGAGYSLYLRCVSNGSSPGGQCNLQYNISVTCVTAIFPSSSSTGNGASDPRGIYGAVVVALLAGLMALMAL